MPASRRRFALAATAAVIPAALLAAGATTVSATTANAAFGVRQILDGNHLHHQVGLKSEALTKPDDLTALGTHLFVAFQNGVGAQGEPSNSGNVSSTVVEFTSAGAVLHQWDITGKCDGLTADPAAGQVIATVNEDLYSSLYTISPATGTVAHYRYSRPLPNNGGTDAITIYHGSILVSASAPGTTGKAAPQAGYPAVFVVTLRPGPRVATVAPLFGDEATAIAANGKGAGKPARLALTDPDSSEVVPGWAARFGGDFMLNSQGDLEEIFWSPGGRLRVLSLSQSIDDTAWARDAHGRLYATTPGSDAVLAVTGRFSAGQELAAVTPCNANTAPATCPAPGFPANYLGTVNPATGQVSRLPVAIKPVSLLFAG